MRKFTKKELQSILPTLKEIAKGLPPMPLTGQYQLMTGTQIMNIMKNQPETFKNQIEIDSIIPHKKYTITSTEGHPINHEKRIIKAWKEEDMEGVNKYVESVREKQRSFLKEIPNEAYIKATEKEMLTLVNGKKVYK